MEVFFENKFNKTNLLNSYIDSSTDSEDLEETVYVKSDKFQLKKYKSNNNKENKNNLFLEESYISFTLIYNNLHDSFLNIQRIFTIERIDNFLFQILFNNTRNIEIETRVSSRYNFYQDKIFYSYVDSLEDDDNSQEVMFNNKVKLNIIAYYDIEGPILYYTNNTFKF